MFQCEYERLDLPCKLCSERGLVCGENEKVLGPRSGITRNGDIPECMTITFIHRQPSTPMDEAITDLDRRYLSILGPEAISGYSDDTFAWRLIGKPGFFDSISLPIFPLSSKLVRSSLLAYAASFSSSPTAKVHVLEYMAKFFSYRKSQSLTPVELLVGSYMAFSLETMQKDKHSSFFENMLVYFEGIVAVLKELEGGIKESDRVVLVFIDAILDICSDNVLMRFGMLNMIISTKMRDRIIEIYRYLICDLLPTLEFISSAVKLNVSLCCFDLLLRLLEATRLRLDRYPPGQCNYVNDLLSKALQLVSNSQLTVFNPSAPCIVSCRCLIYMSLVLSTDFRSSEQAIFYARDICGHHIPVPFHVARCCLDLRSWFWVSLVFAVYPVSDYGGILSLFLD
jgi:hypothetical protein